MIWNDHDRDCGFKWKTTHIQSSSANHHIVWGNVILIVEALRMPAIEWKAYLEHRVLAKVLHHPVQVTPGT